MASVFTPRASIDYSIADGDRFGNVREFVLDGEVLFDENSGIETPEWKRRLVEWIVEAGFNDGNCGSGHPFRLTGFHAFTLRLYEEGLIDLVNID